MDDILDIYIQNTYTDLAQDDIYQTFGLFKAFGVLTPFSQLQELLMMQSFKEPDTLMDSFTGIIVRWQDFILDQHGLTVTDEATLAFRTILMRALFMLQRLADPVPVLRVLESDLSKEEKYCRILSMYTNVPEVAFHQVLDEVRDVALRLLGDLLYMQTDNEPAVSPVSTHLAKMIRAYKEVFGINPAVRIVLDSNIVAGDEFRAYVPLFTELRSQIDDERMLVELLFFFLIYSSDGCNDPMKVYGEYSEELVGDLELGARLGRVLGDMRVTLQRHEEKKQNESN